MKNTTHLIPVFTVDQIKNILETDMSVVTINVPESKRPVKPAGSVSPNSFDKLYCHKFYKKIKITNGYVQTILNGNTQCNGRRVFAHRWFIFTGK